MLSLLRFLGFLGEESKARSTMTRRQAEALGALAALAEHEASGAVHYTALAERLRVSKWTAYDMLLKLERHGLAYRVYDAPGGPGQGGRPRVLFAPTQHGLVALRELSGLGPEEPNWRRLSERLLGWISGTGCADMDGLAAVSEATESSLARCAHAIAALLAAARDSLQGIQPRQSLQRILSSPMTFTTKIGTFCGTVAASLGDRRSELVYDLLSKLELHAGRLKAAERVALLEFVWAALVRLGDAGL